MAVIAELVIAWVEPPYNSFLTDSAIADGLIALGITVEVVLGTMWNNHIQTELRKRSNDKLGAAERAAGEANKRAADTAIVAEQLRSENLILYRVMMARHVGAVGIDQEPPAKQWFADCAKLAGIKVLIQVIPGDPEAQNLANEIAIVLSACGWRPEMIDEKRSSISLNLYEGLSVFSPASHKPWDTQDPVQLKFAALGIAARALAHALTRAGLGIGNNPVSGVHGLIIVVDLPPDSDVAKSEYGKFNPPLDGVYLQIGSRPVSLTLQWMASQRTSAIGQAGLQNAATSQVDTPGLTEG